MFLFKKIVSGLLLPPLGPLLLIALGLLLMRRRRRLGLATAWCGVILGTLLVLPASVGALIAPLERTAVLDPAAAAQAQAIVILGGGKRRNAPEYGSDTVNRLTLERLRYGARLARQTGLPLLVTGGSVEGDGSAEAHLMRESLERDFNVTVRWVEADSRDTRENARFSSRILQEAGIRRVVLVSHAVHLPRAQAEFAAAGIDTLPAPTAFFSGPPDDTFRPLSHLPSGGSAFAGWIAAHEWIGDLARRVGL
jgi:uncharacterized SAM-binding protein YcdF (DUF218 family)